MLLNSEEIIKVLSPVQILGSKKPFITTSACIDSRQVTEGSMFFAFIGENSDGHNFVVHAIRHGAVCTIGTKITSDIEQGLMNNDKGCFILVEDVLLALQKLGALARSKMTSKVVCVTGSLGKTTTKEMIADVLSKFYNVSSSSGNKNNHIGLPLSIINADPKSNITVLELGMNHAGEISVLSKIARPDIAIITTIAPAHVGNFNSVDEIAYAKAEILAGMKPESGIVIVNQLNEYFPLLLKIAKEQGFKTIVGLGDPQKSPIYIEDYSVSLSQSKYSVVCKANATQEVIRCSIPGISYHAAYNTIFVFAVAKLLKLDLNEVQKHVAKFKGVDGRGNLETIMCGVKKITVINDCYNASPESVKSAIETLVSVAKVEPDKRIVCILGDMLELGKFSQEYHEKLGEFIGEKTLISKVITIGEEMKNCYNKLPENVRVQHFETSDTAKKFIRDFVKDGDIILFKASRRMKFETIIEKLYQPSDV